MTDQHIVKEITKTFGKWQILLMLTDCLVTLLIAPQHLATPFYAPQIDHWCKKPENLKELTDKEWKNYSIGYTDGKPNECEMYDVDYGNVTINNYEEYMDEKQNTSWKLKQCTEWDFNHDVWKVTVTEQFSLVCNKFIWKSVSSSMYFVGLFFGVICFGQISDKYGRRFCALISGSIWLIVGFMIPFIDSFVVFTILRFVTGFVNLATSTSIFVMFQESLSSEKRSTYGLMDTFTSAFGQLAISGASFGLKNWKYTQIAMNAPLILLLVFLIYVPESPIWLLSQNKYDRAKKSIERIGKLNNAIFPQDTYIFNHSDDKEVSGKPQSNETLLDIFKWKRVRRRTFVFYFIWFSVSLSYFTLSLRIQDFGTNIFLSMIIASGLDVVGCFISILSLTKIGRKVSTQMSLGIASLCTLSLVILPLIKDFGWIATVVGLIGRSCVGITFNLIYVYTLEVHPTVVRNVGLGSCSMVGRLGSIMAPYSVNLDAATSPYLSKSILAFFLLLASILTFSLPETIKRDLPTTLEDGENFELRSKPTILEDGENFELRSKL